MTDDGICGSTDTSSGEPCETPAHLCQWHDSGSDIPENGRPSELDSEAKEAIYAAVGSGLKVDHVAAAAGISADTLRRWTCCIDDLSEPVPSADACDFCEGYAQAHAQGARDVLEDCRPEFRASASFGYREEKDVNVGGQEDAPPLQVELNETVVETGYDE